MNKAQLSLSIANKVGLPETTVDEVMDAFMEIVIDRLADGEKVQMFGFGTFDIRERGERKMYNPKTEITQKVASRRCVCFKPGKELKALTESL